MQSANSGSRPLLMILSVSLILQCIPLLGQFVPNSEFLDCDWDDEWRTFRVKLLENAEAGFPEDSELAGQAEKLLQENWAVLQPDENAIYGMSLAMQSFFASCNTRPGSVKELKFPFCLYGIVAALWVSARHGHPEGRSLLDHARFLLGEVFRSALDFMESSSWPINSLDVLANQRGEFRLPPELRHTYQLVQKDQKADRSRSELPVLTVWELGVHASLSAEPLQMWARILTKIKLQHRNLISDQYPQWLPNRCETLYQHPRLSCDEVQDDITEFFRRAIPHSATSKDPIEHMATLTLDFQAVAGERLRTVDLFLCTIAYLCLLVEPLDTPIVGYFGHPLLFMVPDVAETREDFWSKFMWMARTDFSTFALKLVPNENI